MRRRLSVLLPVGLMHALFLWMLAATTVNGPAPASLEHLLVTIVETNNPVRASADSSPKVRNIAVLQDPSDPSMSLTSLPDVQIQQENSLSVASSPQLLDSESPPTQSFARQGGLLPGERALVVLRIQVLPDGQAGDVEIDVSSGSDQVDRAARDYARALTWVPARLNNLAESMWIRMGVTLAA